MLPESQYKPTHLTEREIGTTVAGYIGQKLGSPPVGIGLWPGPMLGTTVPETAVNEHRHLLRLEGNVGAASRPWNGNFYPIANAQVSKSGAYRQFSTSITTPCQPHSLPGIRR